MNGLSVRQYGASHGSHHHDHFQILVGLEGELELEVAGRGRRKAYLIALLRTPSGACIEQMMTFTGWQAHYADAQIMPICVGNPASCMAITPTESA